MAPHGGTCVARVIIAMIAAALMSAGCGVTRGDDSRDLLMIIPNSPGGGYDQTGRAAVQVMEDADITGGDFTVDNVDRRRRRGRDDRAHGPGRRRAHHDDRRARRRRLALLLRQRVPARRRHSAGPADERAGGRPGARRLAVQDHRRPGRRPGRPTPARSPSVAAHRRAGPTTCSRCSSPTSVGIDPSDVNYISYDGGGPLTSALLGEKIAGRLLRAGASSSARSSTGELRVLAVSGEERLPQEAFADVPTLTESDIDLVFINWRGVLAPPGISDERARRADRLPPGDARHRRLAGGAEKNGWTDDFKTGDEFATFLEEQDERVSGTLKELGLL